ncbi:branched-chain amino acid ABC transporter substrate-binding protein [Bradyrhizobium sp. UNPF46]|uniref:ABC transporter substrate-binding protein n=1 Tax=Bradyrhizobium sp. UNPF46 TaxID=1141168 RepID=UPI001151EBE7|nr:ABC transporter substrate-binding protein [Bradyrhizobium sp. UNPF46]TQF27627.1 branched-chain amino acid ABC transporter substrate-binding protein [Bradyrhizobium sp. UNPF46]
MPTNQLRLRAVAAALALLAATSSPSFAQKKYDLGATDTEIKIGNIMPYSGPASAYSIMGKTEEAYFRKINAEGGINGRKINFVSYDDAYSPPKAVEQARKLVEGDEVLLVFNPLGTPSNTAVQKYMNSKKVPQLFVASGATKWNNPKDFPWTMGWQPSFQSESHIYAEYIMKEKPNGKIAVLYQNDDYGKDYVKGLKDALGAKAASMIVIEESYEVSQPTIDSNIVKLKSTDADVFFNVTTSKFAAQAIKKMREVDWKPIHILNNVANSVGNVIEPAGFENSQGIISSSYMKDPADAQWKDDPGMKALSDFLDKYYPEADRTDVRVVYGYNVAQGLVQVLKQCGDDLTRANVMRQAASIKDFVPDGVLPGVKVNTSPTDFAPISQLQLARFEGKTWKLFGEIISDHFRN